MTRIRLAALAATLLALPMPALSHQVWLEREGGTVRAYFGEPVEDVRERSGGLLDRIAAPRLFTDDPARPLPLRREADHIQASLPLAGGDVRLVEDGLAPYGRVPEQRTRPIMLAREGRGETRGVMELELVPVAADGNAFTLLLRGQPLPRAEVTVVAPPRWERRLHTDAEGRVTITTPWAGRYVLEAVHAEDRPGGTGDAAYARQRLVSTLSFTVAEGLPWTAAR